MLAVHVAAAALLLFGAVATTRAQDFPNRAITIVTGVGPAATSIFWGEHRRNVSQSAQSGPVLLRLSFSAFDPARTLTLAQHGPGVL
jgi:hypothetical protein